MATVDPVALLERLLQQSAESEWVEFKVNNCDPDEIGRCVSACANASMLKKVDRAFIVFGIENHTKRKVGTIVRLTTAKKGGEDFQNWLCRVITPRLIIEFVGFENEGKSFEIIVIHPAYDRPVRFKGVGYIRIGGNIRKLQEFPEQERALWFATGAHRFESAVALSHQTEREIFDKLEIDAYYSLSTEIRPENPSEIIRHFISREFIKDDWEGGYDITNLGAILFAKTIQTFPSISTKTVRVIKYSGIDKRDSEDEQEGTKGYAVGFSGLRQYIINSLPKHERYVDGIRRRESVYSEIAIREIIANALIHQDFMITGVGPVVEVYSDRVEVINPGSSLIARDRIIDERRSRNEKLAKAMRDLGLCEERGGGIDKAIIDVEERFLPAPEFYDSDTAMRVVLFGPKSFSDLSKEEKIWSCFCHCVVRWISRNYMSNSSLRERFSLEKKDYKIISALISEAKKSGRISPANPNQGNRYARYVPYWAG